MMKPNNKKKIILCILHPTIPIQIIDETLIIEVFQKFGKVKQMLIFEKEVILKAFVEMENSEKALYTIRELH